MKALGSAEYRANEARERALADEASLINNRDTHLRAANRWMILAVHAEAVEKKRSRATDSA